MRCSLGEKRVYFYLVVDAKLEVHVDEVAMSLQHCVHPVDHGVEALALFRRSNHELCPIRFNEQLFSICVPCLARRFAVFNGGKGYYRVKIISVKRLS